MCATSTRTSSATSGWDAAKAVTLLYLDGLSQAEMADT